MGDERKELTDDKLDKVSVKWLSPETIQNKVYNSKTDVWSFGILVCLFRCILKFMLVFRFTKSMLKVESRILVSQTCKQEPRSRPKTIVWKCQRLFIYLFVYPSTPFNDLIF